MVCQRYGYGVYAMRSVFRTISVKLLLIALVCGQLSIGVSFAIAGELTDALAVSWILLEKDAAEKETLEKDITDKDFDLVTYWDRHFAIVRLEGANFSQVHDRQIHSKATSHQYATGPPAR